MAKMDQGLTSELFDRVPLKQRKSFSYQGNNPMVGKTVAKIEFGDPTGRMKQPYTALTLTMTDGTQFVITQCLGQPNIDQVV